MKICENCGRRGCPECNDGWELDSEALWICPECAAEGEMLSFERCKACKHALSCASDSGVIPDGEECAKYVGCECVEVIVECQNVQNHE